MKCKYEHDGDCCNAGADQYRRKCKKPCEFLWALSNADHIRSMTDEELAELFGRVGFCNGIIPKSYCSRQKVCSQRCVADWLKQPYKEET